MGFFINKKDDYCSKCESLKNEQENYKKDWEMLKKDRRMLYCFLRRYEEQFGWDERLPEDFTDVFSCKYSYFIRRMFRLFQKLDGLIERNKVLEDITQRKVLEQRVKDLEEELELRTKQYEKLLKTIKE